MPDIKLQKEDTLKIGSISTLNRLLFDESDHRLIPKMAVDSRFENKAFERTKNFVDSLTKNKKFKILYVGSNKNDSIYQSLITPYFLSNYDHLQMQGINFIGKQNGIYLIITILENKISGWGTTGAGGSSHFNNLYEFFEVENGGVVKYSGYSIGWPNLRKPEKRFSPRYKDLKWVIKQLYKN